MASSLASMAMHVAQRDCFGLISPSFVMKWSQTMKLQILDSPVVIDNIPYMFIYHKIDENNLIHQRLRNNIKEQID